MPGLGRVARPPRETHRPADPEATAGIRKASRNCQPEASGSSATFCAMPTWNGLMGLNDAPTSEAPRLIATATIGREAEPPGEKEEDGNERDQLLLHLDEHAAGGERQPRDRE